MAEKLKKVIAFIPARGGSKSIPLKNIKLIAGKPLIYWTIEAALQANFIEKVYVSTDSEKIKACVETLKNKKITVIPRSAETATDNAPSESALIEFCKNYEFDHVFFIQTTSPLLTTKDLSKAWGKYRKKNYDSLLSVVNQKRFIWEEKNGIAKPKNYVPQQRPRRQEWNGFLVENGAFYISSRKKILDSGCRISGKIGIYVMSEKTYFEIDEVSDWKIIENLLREKKSMKQITRKDNR